MTRDELLEWLADFEPRCRPGLQVTDPGGAVRSMTNLEAMTYRQAIRALREDQAKAADIADFLMGGHDG